jgi:transposase
MEVLYPRCAGLDVHKKTVVASILIHLPNGKKQKEKRSFSTFSHHLREMADWLEGHQIKQVAMESTGVYWKPVWAILSAHRADFELLLVNAKHFKNVPGHKTDPKDAAWLADLLQHGLLRGSFVPPTDIQDLRDLTRYRVALVEEQAATANRIQKLLEQANIKLASVASDVLGVSGRLMLEAIIAGETDPEQLAGMAKRRLRSKKDELRLALDGQVREHHRFLLRELLDHWKLLATGITRLEQEIEKRMTAYEEAVRLWQTIPGVSQVAAWSLVAEIGVKMDQFPTAAQLASWAAVCPGQHESAGKRQSGKMRKGNSWLRRLLCQVGWAASRTKDSYLAAKFHRLAARRGVKRATMAVAHTILIIAYLLLRRKQTYQELGADYLAQCQREQMQRALVKRLERLGLQVSVVPTPSIG